jgi:hypothetical protein
MYAANYAGVVPATLTTAVSDMETAYTDAAGRTSVAAKLNIGSGSIGGKTLTAGVYTFDRNILINSDVTFSGLSTDIFIIQTSGDVTMASGKSVTLADGAQAKNIFWQVAGQVTVATTAHMEGILLVKTAAVFETGSSINGRVLTQTACTLDSTTVTQPPADE